MKTTLMLKIARTTHFSLFYEFVFDISQHFCSFYVVRNLCFCSLAFLCSFRNFVLILHFSHLTFLYSFYVFSPFTFFLILHFCSFYTFAHFLTFFCQLYELFAHFKCFHGSYSMNFLLILSVFTVLIL